MAENSAIEWTDHTFNPWIGCTKVSPGCDHCYAEQRMDKRLHVVQWGAGQPRKRTGEDNWAKPVKWNARAEREGRRFKVFCASLADVFDNEVPEHWRWDLFRLIDKTPHLDWLLLTKRIGNALAMLNDAASAVANEHVGAAEWDRAPWSNVWLGASIVNQAEADRDIPKLLATPAAARFLSMEPLLGPVNLRSLTLNGGGGFDALTGGPVSARDWPGLDWVIVGGESGPSARPMHPDWARSLRAQCNAAGVPFFFKQWGEWVDETHARLDQPLAPHLRKKVFRIDSDGRVYPLRGPGPESYAGIYGVGKKAAGRLLDGRTWDECPT